MSSEASSRSRPRSTTSSTNVVRMTTASKKCSAACGTPPSGLNFCTPCAQIVTGISTRKSVVMASETSARMLSQSGVSGPSMGVQSAERKV